MENMANSQDGDSDMDCSDNECYDEYYYNIHDDTDIDEVDPRNTDPEYFEFKCLQEEQVDRLLNESVETLSNVLFISPSLAKVCGIFNLLVNITYLFIFRFYCTVISGI